jgi:small subunit ribosomal protein S8e
MYLGGDEISFVVFVFLILLCLGVTRKSRILDVVYNASNNELVRTKTLVKNCIVEVDATPFRQWYEQHYALTISGKRAAAAAAAAAATAAAEGTAPAAPVKKSKHVEAVVAGRQKVKAAFDEFMQQQFSTGRLLACVASRPGQSGRCDGYILEGKELEFYHKKVSQKKK